MNKSVKYTIDVNNQGAVTSVKEIDDSLIKLDNTVETVQGSTRQLGNTTKALGGDLNKGKAGITGTTQAVTNLNRVVQDAPFGIIGISNNIEPLVSSFQSLRVQTGSATGALKQLAVSAFTGPGALITVVSLATSALVVFGDELFSLGEDGVDFEKKTEGIIKRFEELLKLRNELFNEQTEESQLIKDIEDTNRVIDELEKKLFELEKSELMGDGTLVDGLLYPFRALGQAINIESKNIDDLEAQLEGFVDLRQKQETKLAEIQALNALKSVESIDSISTAWKAYKEATDINIDDATTQSVLDAIDLEYEQSLDYIDSLLIGQMTLAEAYEKTSERIVDSKLDIIEASAKQAEADEKADKARIEAKRQFTTDFVQLAMLQMGSIEDVVNATRNAMLIEVKSRLAAGLATLVQKAIASVPFPFNIGAATAAAATFSLTFDKIADLIPKFEQGGIVGGNRHRNGGTLIEAEQGEFIVNRNSAMQAPSLLNAINRDPNAASDIEALLSGQMSRMSSGQIGSGTTKVVLSLYDLDQAQRQFNQIQIAGGVL